MHFVYEPRGCGLLWHSRYTWIDEAPTGFLDVYNPTVRALRERMGWFPMPEFRFDLWATGLVAPVFALVFLTPLVEALRQATSA